MNFHDLWNSVEKLSRLIVLANWGIAGTLLVAFACTVVAIKASNRKDELTSAEDLRKAEKIANVEKSNLTLRSQVAGLETNAAEAKAAQQKVEIELAKQQERTANAETAFLRLKQQTEPRRVSAEQRKSFLANITVPVGTHPTIKIMPKGGVPDAEDFARDLSSLLRDAGFAVDDSGIGPMNLIAGLGKGISMAAGINRLHDCQIVANTLVQAGITKPPITVIQSNSADFLVLYVAERPN